MESLSVVLGYGIFVEPNLAYREKYLDLVANDIVRRNPDLVITCGGCSNKDYPDLSEAQSIKDLFVSTHPELSSKIITETSSLTTAQNLEFSLKLIKDDHPDCQSITIYCDSCRVPKIFYLSLSLQNPDLSEEDRLLILTKTCLAPDYDFSKAVEIKHENMTIIGIPLSDTLSLVAHQIVSSMVEMHFEDYPNIHQDVIRARKQKWGIK